MKFRNRIGLITAIVLVVGGLVFMGVQNAKADDIHGTADNITGNSMMVGNKTLVIDGNTEIVGQLVSGSIVQIKARVQDDGTLLATRIVAKNNDDDKDDDDEVEGIIQSIGANNSSIVINGHTILTDEHTRIDDGHLAVNARAEVEVVKQQDGSLLATEIEIEDNDEDDGDDDD
jgi:hypothetical protein